MSVPLEELTGVTSAYHSLIMAQSADRHESVAFIGTKSFLLDSKHKQREPQTLPDKLHKLISGIDHAKAGWGNNILLDDIMYFSDATKIVAASLDGNTVTNFSCTETLPNPRVHYVIEKARKYSKPVPSEFDNQ